MDMEDQMIRISLLTGGDDRPYVFGLTNELLSKGIDIDLIGSDLLDFPEFRGRTGLRFMNLRGGFDPNASLVAKTMRVIKYYARLIGYAARAQPRIFHILWNNRFLHFDRTLLMLYYRVLGKQVVLTAHNVNAEKRDKKDSFLNRLTLRIQYGLCSQIFVHTEKMKRELVEEFCVPDERVRVIPFGINNAVPKTSLTSAEAKERAGLAEGDKAVLFFGRITPYKGLEYLVDAFRKLSSNEDSYRLIVAGRVDRCEEYWSVQKRNIRNTISEGQIILRAEFIPDDETEMYFKAADVLVLPYREIYQSGVMFLAHSFGLPVIAADVGSLKDEIVDGRTGLIFNPEDSGDLVRAIREYFASDLYLDLSRRREDIKAFAKERHSWDVVGQITKGVYADLLRLSASEISRDRDPATAR